MEETSDKAISREKPTEAETSSASQEQSATANPKKRPPSTDNSNERSNGDGGINQGNKKSKKEKQKNTMHLSFDERVDERLLPPHEGSYANPTMRRQYGVSLPQLDEKTDNDKESQTTTITTVTMPSSSSPSSETTLTLDWSKTTKRKVAMLLGFLGTNYGGFQINREIRTIQAEIELALFKARVLNTFNFGRPQKYAWSSSARTDKGVHACAQVISLKIELPYVIKQANENGQSSKASSKSIVDAGKQATDPTKNTTRELLQDMETIRYLIEQQLPPDIRALDVLRTTRNFCAKTQRDRVRYQYILPSFLLYPDYRSLFVQESIPMEGRRDGGNAPLTKEEVERLQRIPALRKFRSTKEQRQILQKALHKYKGTHSFHKFTNKAKFGEASAKRYILEFEVQDPIYMAGDSTDGIEWIPTYVLGQSFLYYQIRKMVSMAIDVARGIAPVTTIDTAFTSDDDKFRVNLAPAQGLFLELSYFEGYNRRKQQNRELPDVDWHKPDSKARSRWKSFRGRVRQHVMKEEGEQGNFIQYMYQQEVLFDYETFYGLNEEKNDTEDDDKGDCGSA